MNGSNRVALAPLALAVALAWTGRAPAADEPSGVADERARTLASELFDQGVKAMERGRCDEAPVGDAAECTSAADRFRRAFELYPDGLGALRNLAYVEKSLGRLATAARCFRELARRAPLDPRPARQLWADFARSELAGLEARVPHLLVIVEAAPPRSTATLDGAALPREAWGTALEVDPGVHALHVEGPARVSFDRSVSVSEGESQTITVSLIPRAEEGRPIERPAPAARVIPARTWALVTAGVGGGLIVVGLGFGAAAISQRRDACGAAGCDVAAYEHGRSLARTSNVVTGLGLATVAGGVVWYLLAPPAASARSRSIVVPWATEGAAGLTFARWF